MGLIIFVSKQEALTEKFLHDELASLCSYVVQNDDHFLYYPKAGKVMALLKMLNENGLAYRFQSTAIEL